MINYSRLNNICQAKIESFSAYADWNAEGRYFFKDNGADILAVAHLDTVTPCTHVKKVKLPHDTLIYTPVLDDRLGAYVILDLLPQLGIKTDILLTVDEEIGKSTGAMFTPEKKYNWMFQFDRAGTDVVMYDYETDDLTALLKSMGFVVGIGSFSDISSMEHVGCKGFNFGVGYHEAHSLNSWASMKELSKMVELFQKFYHSQKDTIMPHTYAEKVYPIYGRGGWGKGLEGMYEYDDRWGYQEYKPRSRDFIRCECCGTLVYEADIWGAIQYDAYDEGVCEECYAKLLGFPTRSAVS